MLELYPPAEPPAFLTVHTAALFMVLIVLFLCTLVLRCARRQAYSPLLRPHGFLMAALLFVFVLAATVLMAGPRAPVLADWICGEALGITLSLLNPTAAVSFFSANLFLRPWEMVPQNPLFATLPKGLAALALVSWLWHGVRHRRVYLVFDPSLFLLLLFVIWLFFADFAAGNPHQGWPYLAELMLPALVLTFLVINTVHSRLELDMLCGSVAISATGLICSALVQTYQAHGGGRLQMFGLLGNSNDLAAVVVLTLPFLYHLFLRHKPFGLRFMFGIIATAVMLYALWLSQSRGARLALLLGIAGHLLFCIRLTLRKVIFTAVAAGILIPIFMSGFREKTDLSASTQARLNYVVTGWRMVQNHPFLGVGVGNYPKLYERFTPSLAEHGERTAHSSWVLVMAESGLPGLFLFGMLCLSALLKSWQLRHAYPGAFLATISYGVSLTFLSHTYLFLPYLMLGIIIAARVCRHES